MKMNSTNERDFVKWIDSDNVIKTAEGYQTQCTQYRASFSRAELLKYFIQEYC